MAGSARGGDLHELGPPNVHNVFDNSLPPALVIESGDSVTFDCPGPVQGEFGDADHPHTIVGPVFVNGAAPGSTLVVDILEVTLASRFGQCIILPGLGLLPDEFEEPYAHSFVLDDDCYAWLNDGVRIPLQPFCGIMGVALAEPGAHSTIPPRRVGGNLDIRHLTAGNTLYLPVEVEGSLFSCGDGHGAQGDGEVCITALETAVSARLKFTVDPRMVVDGPRFRARTPLGRPGDDAAGYYCTAAPGPDLYECSRQAIREMLMYLTVERGLTKEEAYVLCSLAVDLRISEIVDVPNWVVSAYLPLVVFA